jgi:hypothetical protein
MRYTPIRQVGITMNKKELTEADIRTKFITPALAGPAETPTAKASLKGISTFR